jgi:hypothetical protein
MRDKIIIISKFEESSSSYYGTKYRYIHKNKKLPAGEFSEKLLPFYKNKFKVRWKLVNKTFLYNFYKNILQVKEDFTNKIKLCQTKLEK